MLSKIPDLQRRYVSQYTEHAINPSTRTLTEMSTKNLPGVKGRPSRKADSLTAAFVPTVKKMWEPRRPTNLLASKAGYRVSFTFLFHGLNGNVTDLSRNFFASTLLSISPPLWSSGQSSWLQNGDVLCFL
jgi:hypothetical protein